MPPEENRSITRRYFEQVWNEGKLDRFEQYVAADVVPHSSPDVTNREEMKQSLGMIRDAFPDLCYSIDDESAAGDRIVQPWRIGGTHQGELLGLPATGKKAVWSGISILRLAGEESSNTGRSQTPWA